MGVPEYHGRHSRCLGVDVNLLEDMNNVKDLITKLDDFTLRKFPHPRQPIDITPDRDHGGDLLELLQNLSSTYISGVDDKFCPIQTLDRLRPQDSVGVRDDADEAVWNIPRRGI